MSAPFIVMTDDQRTDDWRKARVARLTGTDAADILATLKSGGEPAARRDLRVAMAVERLTGQSQESAFVSADMQRGTDMEPEAVTAYELHTDALVAPVGFLAHPELMAGCSPDGQIGGFTGLVEIKCPKSATHLGYLKAGKVPSDYLPQITHNLWITGAQWCDFVSYDDRFPEPLRLFVRRVHRADVDIAAYELAARLFLTEVEREVEAINALVAA